MIALRVDDIVYDHKVWSVSEHGLPCVILNKDLVFHVEIMGVNCCSTGGFSQYNKHMLALGSHLDYDAQG